jgi:hypothetical protein
MARGFHLEIERLMVKEDSAPTRRRVRLGLSRPGLQPAPGVVAAPAPSAI